MDQANGCHPDAFDQCEGENGSVEGKSATADVPPQAAQSGVPDPQDQTERRQQTLLDWVGHELRNPIAAIELAVHSMRELSDERLDRPLTILERQTRQLSRVVLELLEMARAMSQRSSGVPSPSPVPQASQARPQDGGADRSDERPGGARASAPQRLLVVEDNDDLCGLLREMLTTWGFEVEVATNASSGLAKAAVRPPDIALVDIGLPDRDGCDVARALRRSLPPTLRLIAMSGYGQRQDGARALAAGFDEYLVKPLNIARLRRLLGEAPSLALAAAGHDG
ncbi:MAG TPA: response regulator [Kofleriaceae bacterium]|nr:response regulator [Kofleriaceae bacterium]